MALSNDPNKYAAGGEGKWGDFMGDIGPIPQSTSAQVHDAQLSVIEIGAKYDPADTATLLGILGIYRRTDDDDCKDGR